MKQTLVLDVGYVAINIIPWTDAIRLLCLEKCELVEEYEDVVRSAYTKMNVPAVIRLKKRIQRQGNKKLRLTKYRVFIRDGGACCYCNKKLQLSEATLDHIVPRSQGGQTTWHNVVISCMNDNNMKGGRTPEQAKMPLKKKPYEPSFDSLVSITIRSKSVYDEWKFWLN